MSIFPVVTLPADQEYDRWLTTARVSGGDDTTRLQNLLDAYANEIALGGSRTKRWSVAGLLPGQELVIDDEIDMGRVMGGAFMGAGPRKSLAAGHANYLNTSHLRAAASFPGASVLKLTNVSGARIGGFSIQGAATGDKAAKGIATHSDSGAGFFGNNVFDIEIYYCTVGLAIGPTSSVLDSDCDWYRIGTRDCTTGYRIYHQQSLHHFFHQPAWRESPLGWQIDAGGYVKFINAGCYELQKIGHIVGATSNSGIIEIDGMRIDNTTNACQGLTISDSTTGHGRFAFRKMNWLNDTPTLVDVPFIEMRARWHGILEDCGFLGAPSTGGGGEKNGRLVSILDAGSGTVTGPGILEIHRCDLRTATPSDVLHTLETGHVVNFVDCYRNTGDGYAKVTNSEIVGS